MYSYFLSNVHLSTIVHSRFKIELIWKQDPINDSETVIG